MKILFWNVRGICAPKRHRSVIHLRLSLQPDLILLQETKILEESTERVKRLVWRKADHSASPSSGRAGGILCLWDPYKLEGSQLCLSPFQVTILFSSKTSQDKFLLTNVYAPTSPRGRRDLWTSLDPIKQAVSGIPWILVGDFNTPLHPSDKKGGAEGFFESMRDLGSFINRNSLVDIELRKTKFTWTNDRMGEDHIQVKLDKALLSQEGFPLLASMSLTALPKLGSDHNLLCLEWYKARRMFNSPFRFAKMWMTHESLEENIARWWSKDFHGPILSRVANKLKLVKENLKEWNKSTFGDIFRKKEQLKS